MDKPIDIGSRLELFVDKLLVGALRGTSFKLHTPHLAPAAASPIGELVRRDDAISRSWGTTVLLEGKRYRAYYSQPEPERFLLGKRKDGTQEAACMTRYAESRDGCEWTFPELGMCEVNGSDRNNVILKYCPPFNGVLESPFLDANPDASEAARYKTLAHMRYADMKDWENDRRTWQGGEFLEQQPDSIVGQYALQSSDGLHWERMRDTAVITDPIAAFDSQNVSFWSEVEERYVCYYRTWRTLHGKEKLRTISRTTSPDYLHWEPAIDMAPNVPGEQLYTSQTHPYFRAPHIYVALPSRLGPTGRTDIGFMTTRAGATHFDRLFEEAFIRPGLDPDRWNWKANYVAHGVVPTGPAEMSIYHQSTGGRYVLRTDGFISIHAGADQGEFVTKPLIFSGRELVLNYSTSVMGSVRVEVQSEGSAAPGYALGLCLPLVGDSIEQTVAWTHGTDLGRLSGKPVRLRFVMKEADLFSMRFRE